MQMPAKDSDGGFMWRLTGMEGLAALLDSVVVLLFIPWFVGNIGEYRSPGPYATSDDAHISLAECALDVLLLASAVGAVVCLLRGRGPGVRLQQAVFWALLLRGGFMLFLPGGGIGGFFLFIAAILVLALSVLALFVAISLRMTARRMD
jgi:hypothetical protein